MKRYVHTSETQKSLSIFKTVQKKLHESGFKDSDFTRYSGKHKAKLTVTFGLENVKGVSKNISAVRISNMNRAEELDIVPEGLEEFGPYDSNTLKFVNNFSSYLQDLLPDYNVNKKYEGFGSNELDIILEVTDEADNTMPNWPSRRFWSSIEDDETFDEAWSTYLAGPEDEVNKELQIFPEPSVQGGMGGLFVFDESGEDRKDEDEDWYVDWQDYNYWQLKAAASSKSAEEYKNKYRKYMKDLCGI